MELRPKIESALSKPVKGLSKLSGGCVGEVYLVTMVDGSELVCKVDSTSSATLDIEAYMLNYLNSKSQLPVPEVLHAEKTLLLMEYLESDSLISSSVETDAADILGRLHSIKTDRFGFEKDTLIGALPQCNSWKDSWVEFFAENRIMNMGLQALKANQLSKDLFNRLERFSQDLANFIDEPAKASLLHGDIWSGNVLAKNGKIAAFIDPAIYFGDNEMELAFITMFSTFGDAFFQRYNDIRPIRPEFFESRKDILNLFPLLVHVRLFGGGYVNSVSSTLKRFGY